MNNEQTYRLIKNYLKGNLSKKEVIDFENRLKTDDDFKAIFETEKAIFITLKINEISSVSQQLNQLKLKSNKRRIIKQWSIVGSGLLLILLVTIFLNYTHSSNEIEIGKPCLKQETSYLYHNKLANETEQLVKEPENLFNPIIETNSQNVTFDGSKVDSNKLATYEKKNNDNLIAIDSTDKKAIIQLPPTNKKENGIKPDTIVKNEVENKDKPCKAELTSVDIQVSPSCSEYGSGTIVLNEGKSFSINDGISFSSNPLFENLKGGNYLVKIKDAKGCESESISVYVDDFECNAIVSYSQFNYWEPNLSFFDDYAKIDLTIYHGRSRVMVYNKTLEKSVPFTWQGINSNGSQLGKGNYIYILTNNQSGKQVKGQITIID